MDRVPTKYLGRSSRLYSIWCRHFYDNRSVVGINVNLNKMPLHRGEPLWSLQDLQLMNPGILDRKIFHRAPSAGVILARRRRELFDRHGRNSPDHHPTAKGALRAEQDVWGVWKTRRARRMEKSGSESTENGRKIGREVVIFEIRFTPDLKLTDRIVHHALIYDIVGIIEKGRRLLQHIECVLHANSRPA